PTVPPRRCSVTDLPLFPFRTSCVSHSTSVKITRLVPKERHSERELSTFPTKTRSARSVISWNVGGMTVVAFEAVKKSQEKAQAVVATPVACFVILALELLVTTAGNTIQSTRRRLRR